MKVRKLLLCILLFIVLVPHISYGVNNNPRVYFIVVNKLTLKDIQSMDNFKNIIEDGSIGLMNTRGLSGYTGAESFLTINSSRKAYGNYDSIDFETEEFGAIVNKSFSKLINLNKNNNYSPHLGAIGDNLHKAGLTTAIYGNSDLINMPLKTSALIPMDSQGLVDYGNIDNITIEEKEYPFVLKTDYNKLLNEVENSPADFIVGDTGDLERLYRYKDYLSDNEFNIIRERMLLDIDNFIRDLTDIIDKDNSLLIITSPNIGDINVDDNKLSPIILWGSGIEKGQLVSKTTNREGIIGNIDIGPTVMNFLGAPRDNMSGSQIEIIKNNIDLNDIIIESQQINTTSKVRYNALYYYGIISMILLALGIIFFLAKIRLSNNIKEIMRNLFTVLLIMPSIFIIISVFKPTGVYSFTYILWGLIILSYIIVIMTRKSKNQITYIGLISISIILLDLILKGAISKYSVLSHDPIIGARYYGIGNEMVGLLLGFISVLSIKILEKNNKSLLPLILFCIAGILVAHPGYGANVGGTMAFVVATVSYVMEFSNKDFSLKRAIFMIISIIVLISIMGYIDIKFNKNTTHLGNTILLIKNNGLYYLNQIVLRKILMNIKLIGRSFWTYLLLLHMFFHAVIFHLSKEMNKKTLIATIAGISGAIGGFLLNDSGIILAAICMNLITLELYLEYI